VKDVRVSLGTTVDLDSRWALTLNGQYTRLVGDAADSPVVETADQFSAMAGLTYRFEIANPFGR
jgi:outer membrane scaffolding protein for murein synthesis (MipA/OmpV family)